MTTNNRDEQNFFEALEPRTLFAATAFASVGLAYEDGTHNEIHTTLYGTEGVIDTATGDVDGTTFAAGHFDRESVGPLLFGNIQNLDTGRYLRHPNNGTQGEAVESNGARFLTRDGFPAGWWFADFGGGEQEVEWIVERPTDALPEDFQGTWRFASISTDESNDDFSNAFGDLVIGASAVQWNVEQGSFPRGSSAILTTTPDGLLKTNAAEYMYLSADGSVLIFADMAEEDQQVYIGVAVRENPAPFAGDIVGEYLLAWAFADGPADNTPNEEVAYRQRYVRLDDDGRYHIWSLDDYDSGNTGEEWAINRGTWTVSDGEVVLEEQDTGDLAWFTVADNASTLVGFLLQNDTDDDPVLGLATRAFPELPAEPGGVFTVPGEGPDNLQLVYELGTDDVWEVTNLIGEAGGPEINGSIVTWIDPKDGHAYAVGMTDQGVVLYSEPDQGDWTYRNLSDETLGESITDGLQFMIAPDGIVHVTGLNADGELVRYYQTGAAASDGSFDWAFVNIDSHDLAPQGQHTPAFVGALTAYATSWNGLNVAGLDAEGRIWSVWWAPGLERWTVTDLSAASGAGPVVGNLAVYLTPWNGINLAGLDDNGHLQVTWWVPQFEGDWARNDLTAETNGPTFVIGSVTSYVSSWGGLNVAGMDADSGEIKVYWWVPEHTEIGWLVTSISQSVPIDAPVITDFDIRGIAAPDGSLNVFGYAEDGSYVNYYWYPGFGGDWRAENLSDTAVDR
jgi:hypothetical protein